MTRGFVLAAASLLAACSDGSNRATGEDAAVDPTRIDGGVASDGTVIDAAPPCSPTAGPPIWIEETETATASIACATGADPGPSGFDIVLPAGASYDADTRTFSFTPGLDQAAVYALEIRALDRGETGLLEIGVADRFDDPGNLPVANPIAYPSELGIPAIFISPRPTSSLAYQAITVVYGGRTYQVQGKTRGASSLGYPKQSFTLDFSGDHLEDPANGFVDKKKVVLTTTFDDNSGIRSRLTWSLWNRLQPTVAVTAFTVAVYLDGAYAGIYTFSDHIDDELMAQRGLPEAGNLYKAVDHNANFKTTRSGGQPKANLHEGYEKKHGAPAVPAPDAFADLDALVAFVAGADDTTFAAEIEDRIWVPDFQAWWLLATFLKLDDSAGKNAYLHHSTVTPWHVVPWDFNDSLGQNWFTLRLTGSPINTYTGYNALFHRLVNHPSTGPEIAARYAAELHSGAFALDDVIAQIDAIVAEIGPNIGRDERRWRAQYLTYRSWSSRTDFTTAAEEIAYIKQWIEQRWAVLDALYP